MLEAGFMPHFHCYAVADPGLFAWRVTANVVIALAYLGIPALIARAWQAGHLPGWVCLAFSSFILFCGAGHGVSAAAEWWWPAYRLETALDVATAAVSGAVLYALHVALQRATQARRTSEEQLQAAQSEASELRARLDKYRTAMDEAGGRLA